MGHNEKMQVLDHLIEGLEQEAVGDLSAAEATESVQDDARWDTSFANSQEVLARMAARTRQHRDQGLNQELDPDTL